MTAMWEEQNNEIYLHKNKTFFSVETNSIVFSSSMAAANTLYKEILIVQRSENDKDLWEHEPTPAVSSCPDKTFCFH